MAFFRLIVIVDLFLFNSIVMGVLSLIVNAHSSRINSIL